MDMKGFSISVIESLMAYGIVRNYVDLFHLKDHIDEISMIEGFGSGKVFSLIEEAGAKKRCKLSMFLTGVGIPLMGYSNAKSISEYFFGSWKKFEKAIQDNFMFFHIEGVSRALSDNILSWYNDENERELWEPLVGELEFDGDADEMKDTDGLSGKVVAYTGDIFGLDSVTLEEILKGFGAGISDTVNDSVQWLIVGQNPDADVISAAVSMDVKIMTAKQFEKLLAGSG